MQASLQSQTQLAGRQQTLYRGSDGTTRSGGQQLSSTRADAFPQLNSTRAGTSRLLLTGGNPRDEHVISSQNRYKYFKRPVIPFMNAQPPEVRAAQCTVRLICTPQGKRRFSVPSSRDVDSWCGAAP